MKISVLTNIWSKWGLVPRLMFAVGLAVIVGGSVQTFLFVAEGASEHSSRLKRELTETLTFLAPLVADQALVGEYAAIEQLLKKQVTKSEMDRLEWTDSQGRKIVAQDVPDKLDAPKWFTVFASIEVAGETADVKAGGVGYGTLSAKMTPIKTQNRLWLQFVKQIQILAVTLFLMLQFIWLIFRGNLGTLRMLAEGANRFSQGDHAVRISAEGSPEVRVAAEAFNNMANNTENLLASLSASESKNKLLATIVEQSSEAIWTEDIDGVITSWNAGAVAMLGHSQTEALGHALKIDESDSAEVGERMRRLAASERFSYDTKAMTVSGSRIDMQVAVAPLVNDSNEFVGTISVARDVTQSKRAEEALRVARVAAESANHAKSSFLARMSHEIRTPMNGVLGMTELLLETGLSSVQRKYAETVQSSGKNLLAIINDVLDFSKIEAGKLELEKVELDVRRSLEDIVDLLAERAHAKGLELACRIPADLNTRVMGDPLRLGQILTNLTGNAIKFTQNGAVVIGVGGVEHTDTTVTLRFEVSDTGVGISEEAQSRIFDEFSQADDSTTRKHGGSGLGLAISRQLVEMMGGRIELTSALGKGSTFAFECKFEKQPEPLFVTPDELPLGALTGLRTLIIESSAISRGILYSQVCNWEMNVRVAETAEHALELLAQATARGAPFDLAIIDLGHSGKDSLDLARSIRLKVAIAGVRLVMLTPVGNHALLKDAHGVGIDACLVKPVRQSHLYESLVQVMLGGHSHAVEIASVAEAIASAPLAGSRGKILLVEDNLVNQAVALGMLNRLQGYEVVIAKNGHEALAALAERGGRAFDIVLMDCHMPEMDGFETTLEIRKRERDSNSKRIPIIALTANAMDQDREDCLNAGMDDHLAKPLSRQQLQVKIDLWMPEVVSVPVNTEKVVTERGVAESAAKDLDVLDRQVLAQLRELENAEDPNLLSRVLQLYLNESPRLFDQLKQAVLQHEAREIELSAHALKSSSANVGATVLAGLCVEIHSAVRLLDFNRVRQIFAEAEIAFTHVQSALTTEITRLAATPALTSATASSGWKT
jgi:two-component system, sensor histidine kinase and response regulator